MKGFVSTPDDTVDFMVSLLFRGKPPAAENTILDPGCGEGAFADGILRWCEIQGSPVPRIVGVESHPGRASDARKKFADRPQVEIRGDDFLLSRPEQYDFIIGNPPYVPITGLTEREKASYRRRFATAQGRFDLYILFFEQALLSLKPGGRLVFVTPEKFLYVETAATLRKLLARLQVEEIRLVNEATFGERITYPTITTIVNGASDSPTQVVLRTGKSISLSLPANGRSWLPLFDGKRQTGNDKATLGDICRRISCGVATGADSVFVRRTRSIQLGEKPFAHPTIAGRQLGPANPDLCTDYSMLVPYRRDGALLDERYLGALGQYLSETKVRDRLMARTCVDRKPWYAFHESPRLEEILRPKILCKDITQSPRFWVERAGRLVPRHSVYYIVPKHPGQIDQLCAYLNSDTAQEWLSSHCQHAANGFLRLQSRILKQMPIPAGFANARDSAQPFADAPGRLTIETGPFSLRP